MTGRREGAARAVRGPVRHACGKPPTLVRQPACFALAPGVVHHGGLASHGLDAGAPAGCGARPWDRPYCAAVGWTRGQADQPGAGVGCQWARSTNCDECPKPRGTAVCGVMSHATPGARTWEVTIRAVWREPQPSARVNGASGPRCRPGNVVLAARSGAGSESRRGPSSQISFDAVEVKIYSPPPVMGALALAGSAPVLAGAQMAAAPP